MQKVKILLAFLIFCFSLLAAFSFYLSQINEKENLYGIFKEIVMSNIDKEKVEVIENYLRMCNTNITYFGVTIDCTKLDKEKPFEGVLKIFFDSIYEEKTNIEEIEILKARENEFLQKKFVLFLLTRGGHEQIKKFWIATSIVALILAISILFLKGKTKFLVLVIPFLLNSIIFFIPRFVSPILEEKLPSVYPYLKFKILSLISLTFFVLAAAFFICFALSFFLKKKESKKKK